MTAGGQGPDLRAVLHHQGAGQGDRAGAGHGVRDRQAERRARRRCTASSGPGTTFKVYLPAGRAAGDRPAAAARRPAAAAAGRRRSCWSRTRPAVRALARRVLRARGYTVLEAADGDEAVRVAGRARRADPPAGDRRGHAGDGRAGAGRAAGGGPARAAGAVHVAGTRTTRSSGTACCEAEVALPAEAVHPGGPGPEGAGGAGRPGAVGPSADCRPGSAGASSVQMTPTTRPGSNAGGSVRVEGVGVPRPRHTAAVGRGGGEHSAGRTPPPVAPRGSGRPPARWSRLRSPTRRPCGATSRRPGLPVSEAGPAGRRRARSDSPG